LRIACIDKDSKARLSLHRLIESAFTNCCEGSGGYGSITPYPASLEEILLSSPPECVLLGPAQGLESTVQVCRKLRSEFPGVGIVVLLPEESFSLRSLRRFESLADDCISSSDGEIRLVHSISILSQQRKAVREGKLIFVTGAKGGVGTTSVVSGLAHASEALGNSSVVLDLSSAGVLIQFIAAQRWQSPDYAAALTDKLSFDDRLLDKLLTKAPNGINLMLPPAGGLEIRERWLRDPVLFESTLTLVDLLKERFGHVIIDHAAAEGILPFSLAAAADSICLVTSNEPASAHLLNSRLSEVLGLPGERNIQIFINQTESKQLSSSDVVDYLYANEGFEPFMCLAQPLNLDARGRFWVGTGNSFYTESSEPTQRTLEDLLRVLCLTPAEVEQRANQTGRVLFSGLRRWANSLVGRGGSQISAPRALPYLQQDGSSEVEPLTSSSEAVNSSLKPEVEALKSRISLSEKTSLLRPSESEPQSSTISFKVKNKAASQVLPPAKAIFEPAEEVSVAETNNHSSN